MPPFQPNIAIVALKRLLEILMHYKWLAKEWHWQKDDLQTFMRQPQLLSIMFETEKKLCTRWSAVCLTISDFELLNAKYSIITYDCDWTKQFGRSTGHDNASWRVRLPLGCPNLACIATHSHSPSQV